MFDTDDIGSNTTDNPHLDDLIRVRVSRRSLLGGGLAAAAVGFFGVGILEAVPAAAASGSSQPKAATGKPGSLLGFAPVEPSSDDVVRVPAGYAADVLVPWGTPLVAGVLWKDDASNTAAEQEQQVGFNHDGMHYFPLSHGPVGSERGLLVINHEYTDASQIYSAAEGSAITPDDAGREKVAKALAGHGVTVVEVRKKHGAWEHVVGSRYNRRITGSTPMAFSGPVAANHVKLQSSITPSPIGTLNNCGHGVTPWGTYLTAEENWNGYFGTTAAWTPSAVEARYGVTRGGFGYNWHVADARFDVAQNPNELNRFGWIVEIDPTDPTSVPTKRTALGRLKHEGATVLEQNGHAVVYSGDDENGDYLYKYVSARPWRQMRAEGVSPLDDGVLYVAAFDANGAGRWLALTHGVGELTVANGWIDQADVLLRTRLAADARGATRLHRPEWVGVNNRTGDVFVTLTNGTGNGSPANSDRDPNPYGHIIRFREAGNVHSPDAFVWDVFLFAGDRAYPNLDGGKVPAGQPIFGSPDGIWVDPDGRVWIQTDISNSSQNLASRGYDNIKNNQMLVADPDTREVRRFLTGPRGCEITGVVTTPDQKTMFVNVQHPGEATTAWGTPTTANPKAVSSWPGGPSSARPRPATIVIRKLDGGTIGS